MVPSVARIACIARVAFTNLDQNSGKQTCRNRVVPWVGFKDYIYFFKRRVRVGGSVVVVHTQKKTTWYSRVASGGTAIINNRNENVLLCTDCCTTNKSGAAGERRRTSKKVIHTASGISYFVQRRAERSMSNTHSNQAMYKLVLLLCITVCSQQKQRRASDGGRAKYMHTANTAAVVKY